MNFDIINALLTGFFLAFMVGPVFFVLIETSITKGFKGALVFDLGVVLADVIFIIISFYGSYTILNKIKDDPMLFFAGGMLLFVFGFVSYIKEKKVIIEPNSKLLVIEKTNFSGLFIKGFLLNFINVGVLGFWLALVIVISTNVNMNSQRIFIYFTTVIIGYFVTDIGKILLAKQLKNKMTPIIIKKTRLIMGVILMVIGLVVASKGLMPKDTLNQLKSTIGSLLS